MAISEVQLVQFKNFIWKHIINVLKWNLLFTTPVWVMMVIVETCKMKKWVYQPKKKM